MLIQGLVGKVICTHAGLLVIELVHPHVLFLDFYCAIVEWVKAMLTGSDSNFHFRSNNLTINTSNSLGCDSKNFAHNYISNKQLI